MGQPAAPPLFEEAGAHAGARVDETGLFAAVTWALNRAGRAPSCEAAALQGKEKTSSRRARGAGASEDEEEKEKPAEEGTEGGKEEMESTRRDVGSAPGATAASAAALARDLRLDTSGAMDDMTGGCAKIGDGRERDAWRRYARLLAAGLMVRRHDPDDCGPPRTRARLD